MKISKAPTEGYILRITTKKWVKQVFDWAMYYTSAPRKRTPEQTILFLTRTDVGNAFINYGILEKILDTDELSEEEHYRCKKHCWKKALEFKYILKFEKPLPIQKTFLKDSKLRGAYLHGLKLDQDQLNSRA